MRKHSDNPLHKGGDLLMEKQTIMIVEDETGIREMTERYLSQEGFLVFTAKNGKEALEKVDVTNPDLILLDIEMPELDGFAVCKEIRKKMTVPIIFLTVRRGTLDKVKCFELGGDDYVTKPFDFEELLARIKANIRRYHTLPHMHANKLTYGKLEIHLDNLECYADGELINLTAKEMELLIFLAEHPNQVLSHEQLYNQVWSLEGTGNIETVKVHISYLRKKLKMSANESPYIKTVHGFGYLFSG